MTFQIKTVKNISTMIVTDGDVTCTLVLDPKCHEIKTKGEDTNNLTQRIGYSYRTCFGNGNFDTILLKAIKKDLIESSSTKEHKK